MNIEAVKRAVAGFREARQRGDRLPLIDSARVLISERAPIGDQWPNLWSELVTWGEMDLAISAIEEWGRQGGPRDQVAYEKAVILAQVGRTNEAAVLMRQVPDNVPDPLANAHFRGALCSNLDQPDRAEKHFRDAIAIQPRFGRVWVALADLGRLTGDDAAQILRDFTQPFAGEDLDLAAAHSALGSYYHSLKDFERAFEHYRKSHEVSAKSYHYDPAENRESARISASWNRASIAQHSVISDASPRQPIFVAGLPRSGTTLVSQILSAHSAVDGGAELGLSRQLEATVGGFAPHDFERFVAGGGTPESLRDIYLRLAAERIPGNGKFVDKSLNHGRALGPLSALFPDSPVVWMRRDPLDNAWSIYRTWLPRNVISGWAPADIVDHMSVEDELFDHWSKVLGDRMLAVSYADLVADPDRWIDRITRHCGLEPEEAQLRFHEQGGSVLTASAQQVRRPINRAGIGVAEPYREMLGEFTDALARQGREA